MGVSCSHCPNKVCHIPGHLTPTQVPTSQINLSPRPNLQIPLIAVTLVQSSISLQHPLCSGLELKSLSVEIPLHPQFLL